MPVKTRQKQNTKKTVKLKQKPQLRQLPRKKRHLHAQKPPNNLDDLYYSDQDLHQVKKQEEDQKSLKEEKIKAEQNIQQVDSKIQEQIIIPQSAQRREKKEQKQISTKIPAGLKPRSKKIANEMAKMNSIQSQSLAKAELNKPSMSKQRKLGEILPNAHEMMIPEEEPTPPCIPFLKQHNSNVQDLHLQKPPKRSYREFKMDQSFEQTKIQRKVDFDRKLQKYLLQNILGKPSDNQKQIIDKFQQLKDYLFQKCKSMDQKELVYYRKTQQYNQLLQQLIRLHPYNSLTQKSKRKLDLKINSAISQTFSFTNKNQVFNKEARQFRFTMEIEDLQPVTKYPIIKESKGSKYLNQEKSQSKNHPSKNQESKSSVSEVQSSIKNKSRRSKGESSVDDSKKHILTKIKNANYNNHQRKSNWPLKQTLSQQNKNKLQSNKIETLDKKPQMIKCDIQPDRVSNQPRTLQISQGNQLSVRTSEQLEISSKQSNFKTDETRKQRRNQMKQLAIKYNYRFNNWAETCKPPKKRLQILNRFQYNPFELDNGEDQCELWKKLMADQFDDLRGKYKYQGPRDFFLKQPEDDYILPLKVKQEDFFIPSEYDPKNKSIKKEKIQNLGYEELVKEQEDAKYILQGNSQILIKIEELKTPQIRKRGVYIPPKQFVPKCDYNEENFNYDFLEDLEVPSLPSQRQQIDKGYDLDFF